MNLLLNNLFNGKWNIKTIPVNFNEQAVSYRSSTNIANVAWQSPGTCKYHVIARFSLLRGTKQTQSRRCFAGADLQSVPHNTEVTNCKSAPATVIKMPFGAKKCLRSTLLSTTALN